MGFLFKGLAEFYGTQKKLKQLIRNQKQANPLNSRVSTFFIDFVVFYDPESPSLPKIHMKISQRPFDLLTQITEFLANFKETKVYLFQMHVFGKHLQIKVYSFYYIKLSNLENIEMSLSKLNPDWQAAQVHGTSTKPGIHDHYKATSEQLICPCCLNIIHKQPAPLCQNSKQLQFLGFGFPMFYVFLKYCIILLVMTNCSYNGIQLYWSFSQGSDLCKELESGCTSIMVELARIQKKVSGEEIVVRVLSFFVQLCLLIYIRDLVIKTRNYYDQRTCSLSDYSLIVHDLPKRKGTKKNLIKFLDKCFNRTPYHITFLPQYEAFYEMEEKCNQVTQSIKQVMRLPQSQQNQDKIKKLQQQLERRQKKLQSYCDRQLQLQQLDEVVAQKLIFSCETQDDKCFILEKFEQISEEKLRQHFQILPEEECLISIEQAPQPKEINWQHINYPSHKRFLRMLLGWIMTFIFLGIITTIFFMTLSQKSVLIQHASEASTDGTAHGSSFGVAIFIVYLAIISVILFNKFVMGMVLHKICDFQMHQTTAQEQFHFAMKYSVGLFFTTALMTLAVEDIKFANFYSHPYGVIQQETVMFIMNAFFVPLIWLINPWHMHTLIKRKLNYGRKDLTQKEANKLMENVQYNMGKRYAEILQIMWFTFLYSSLIPLGGLLSTIGLCLYYWVDKYNLLRRSSVNSNVAGELSLYAMKLLDFTLICKPVGQIIFDSQIRDSYCLTSLVTLATGIVYLLLPIDRFLEYFHPQKFHNQQKHLQEVEKNFRETYQTLHPIFSLKKQNQDKLFAAFKMLDFALENSGQLFQKKQEEQDQEKYHQNIHNDTEAKFPPELTSSDVLKDASNVFQTFFKMNSYITFKQKDNFQQGSNL